MKTAKLTRYRGRKYFTWDGNNGYADMSDLPGKKVPQTFAIVSERTKKTLVFECDRRVTDPEGELKALVYKSKDKQYTVTLFND